MDEGFSLKGLIPHFEELRARIVFLAIAFIVLFFAGFSVSKPVITYLTSLFETFDLSIVVGGPLEYVFSQVKVSMVIALIILVPLFLYHTIRFVSPGLKKSEKRWIYFVIPFCLFLFVAGIAFAIVVLQMSLYVLSVLAIDSGVLNLWSLHDLISVLVGVSLFFAFLFQMPLILLFFNKLGIISRELLSSNRRITFMIMLAFSAMITPTVDPVTMLIVALPMVLLFELSIGLMWFASRKATAASS